MWVEMTLRAMHRKWVRPGLTFGVMFLGKHRKICIPGFNQKKILTPNHNSSPSNIPLLQYHDLTPSSTNWCTFLNTDPFSLSEHIVNYYSNKKVPMIYINILCLNIDICNVLLSSLFIGVSIPAFMSELCKIGLEYIKKVIWCMWSCLYVLTWNISIFYEKKWIRLLQSVVTFNGIEHLNDMACIWNTNSIQKWLRKISQ